MKTVEYNAGKHRPVIRFERIKPFKNICKVTGVEENCNVVVEYVPSNKVVDIVDYRKFFEKGFNELIEDIAQIVFKEIQESANPLYLRVQVFLEGNQHLTDWSVTVDSDN